MSWDIHGDSGCDSPSWKSNVASCELNSMIGAMANMRGGSHGPGVALRMSVTLKGASCFWLILKGTTAASYAQVLGF